MARAGSKASEIARRADDPTERRLPRWRGRRSIGLSPRLRAELTAIALFTLAVLVALPLVGMGGAGVLDLLVSGIRGLLGHAVWAVPFGLAIVAAEVWHADEAEQRYRRMLGGVLLLLAVTGLLSLTYDDLSAAQSGGLAGDGVAYLLLQLLGEVGSAILLLAVGLIAVLLVCGNDTDTLRWTWRKLRPRSSAPRETATELGHLVESADATPERTVTQQFAATGGQPGEAEMAGRVGGVKKPVINVPAGGDPAKEIQGAVVALTDAIPGDSATDAQ